jgi:hypothetical protein
MRDRMDQVEIKITTQEFDTAAKELNILDLS